MFDEVFGGSRLKVTVATMTELCLYHNHILARKAKCDHNVAAVAGQYDYENNLLIIKQIKRKLIERKHASEYVLQYEGKL